MTQEGHVRDQLIAYLSGNLDEKTTAEVAGHVGGCEACGRELDSIRKVWLSLGNIPDELPSPEMARRFHATLQATVQAVEAAERAERPAAHGEVPDPAEGRSWGWLDWISPRHPAVQFALVLVLFLVGGVVGGLVGYRAGSGNIDTTGMVQLRDEVRSVNRLLIVSLLQQQSATERLQGVSWSYKVDRPDPEVTGALLQTLNQDPNVNVRLAALDAVSRSVSEPQVRAGLLRSLADTTAPMIQLAILDVVVRSNMKESTSALKDLLKKPGVNAVVKNRIEQALQYLNI